MSVTLQTPFGVQRKPYGGARSAEFPNEIAHIFWDGCGGQKWSFSASKLGAQRLAVRFALDPERSL